MLLLGGDIKLNPSPKASSIFLFGYCEWTVNPAICCNNCSIWLHKTYTGVGAQENECLEKADDSTI